jgi:hypothetical protein
VKTTRILLTIPAALTAVVPLLADSNTTHQLNHHWPPHARFHGAVLVLANVLLGALALWLVWGRRDSADAPQRLRIAAVLPAVLWGSFFPALLAPGASPWPDGIVPPAALPFPGNLVLAAIIVVLCGVGGYRAGARFGRVR